MILSTIHRSTKSLGLSGTSWDLPDQPRLARADYSGVQQFNTGLPAAIESCSKVMGQGSEIRNKHGSSAVAHSVQTVTQTWSSFTAPVSEAKAIYQLSVHYSSSTTGSSVVSGTKELCVVVLSNTSNLFHPIQDGGGDGVLWHMNHFYLLMFLFTFIPKVLVCCISSEWDRVWAGYRRKDLHLQRSVHIFPSLPIWAERTLSSKIYIFLIWIQAKRLLFLWKTCPGATKIFSEGLGDVLLDKLLTSSMFQLRKNLVFTDLECV